MGIRSILLALLLLSAQSSRVRAQDIDACGRLYAAPGGCCLFTPLETAEYTYLLRDVIACPTGDIVRVKGRSQNCHIQCDLMTLFDCIDVHAVTPCEPESLGCGIVTDPHLLGCWLWISPVWGPLLMPLPNHYADGDTTFAVGFVDFACYSACGMGVGCLEATLTPCQSTTPVRPTTWGLLKTLRQ